MKFERQDIKLTPSLKSQECETCPLQGTCETDNKDLFLRLSLETDILKPCSRRKIQLTDRIRSPWGVRIGDFYNYNGSFRICKRSPEKGKIDGNPVLFCTGIRITEDNIKLLHYDVKKNGYYERVSVEYGVLFKDEDVMLVDYRSRYDYDVLAKVKYLHELQALVRKIRKNSLNSQNFN